MSSPVALRTYACMKVEAIGDLLYELKYVDTRKIRTR